MPDIHAKTQLLDRRSSSWLQLSPLLLYIPFGVVPSVDGGVKVGARRPRGSKSDACSQRRATVMRGWCTAASF